MPDSEDSAIYAADLIFSYDADSIEFVSADSLKSGFGVVMEKTDLPGQLRIIAASEGTAGAITSDEDILKINWKAKSLDESLPANITLAKGIFATALGHKTESTRPDYAFTLSVADWTTLQVSIQSAQSLYNSSTEGTESGQYPAGSKAVLLTAINTANAVYTNAAATQQQIDDAADTLNQAVQVFRQQVIPARKPGDIDGQDGVDIGDLGIVAANYGKTTASSDWNQARVADLNNDGKIDIVDLAAIAQLILE